MKIPKTKYIGVLNIKKYDNTILKIKKSKYFKKNEYTKNDIEVIFNGINDTKNIFTYENLYKVMTIYGIVYIYDWENIIYGFGNNQIGIEIAILNYYKTTHIYENMHDLIGEKREENIE